jgi:hypothetical protein
LGEKEVTDHTVASKFSVSNRDIIVLFSWRYKTTHAMLYGIISLKLRQMGLRQQKAISGIFGLAHGDNPYWLFQT